MNRNDEMSAFMAVFGALANQGGGDRGEAFPRSDAEDFKNGARYIPGEVTLARRRGEKVTFNAAEHSWLMQDGSIVT